ncbi:hypothetical protein GCM10011391_28100 [Pullulanibacillus camelliae]|uniref:Minor capsid protein n=1 Tax=Pullulanibacillus camelliae TaxID=1707096 RepID=A0A8J3DYS1_9BACL|nr:phage minor capsid protein [Pullulanibacillus camelliae]GGE47715.1 hypothetical protein GCM10011391_28100 [Pullulanibacillus camelliae]
MDYQKQQQLTIPVVQVYLAIEEQILINAAKKLRKDKSLLNNDVHSWQSKKLAELESLTQTNIIIIAKHSKLAVNEVTKMLRQAGYKTLEEFEGDLEEAVQQGKLIQPPSISESVALNSVLSSYQRQAKDTFNLINSTLLNQGKEVYRDILSQTVGKVLTGNMTGQQALREVSQKWAEKGVPALIDKAGKRWSTEAYVNMVTRSMSNNVANDMQDTRFDEYDVDLVEVSSHAGSRPSHIPFQGRIYSRSGNSDKYPPLSDTGYGTIEGIGGINCMHVLYPYIPGVSKKRYQPYDAKESKRVYAESQKQRYLERRIRAAKREKMMLESMGDEGGVKLANKKIRERQAVMREFIDKTERTRRRNREQIS